VNLVLRQFKNDDGNANFPALLSVPSEFRLASMARENYEDTNMLIIGALTVALENINVKRGLNEFQILNLSELIIEESSQDNLSLEDVLLFLQQLVVGKFEMSYESMDIPKFMKMFEQYREERHQNLVNYRMEKHAQYSVSGNTGRTNSADPLSEHFSKLGDTIGRLKDSLKETKKENEILKKVDKF